MNYLFFDTECARGFGGICEFGYVLTDEKFNEIKADNMLIDPGISFDDYGHKKAGIIFAHTKSEYYSSPEFYNRIKSIERLLTDKNNIVVGYSTDSDAKFLINDIERYSLKGFDYKFIDLLRLFKIATGREKDLKLDIIYGETGGKEVKHHEALNDARMTVKVFDYLSKQVGLSGIDLINKYPICQGEVYKNRIIFNNGSIFSYTKGGKTTIGNKKLIANMINDDEMIVKSDILKKYVVTVAPDYVKEHFEETLSICHYVKTNGGEFTLGTCDANVIYLPKGCTIDRSKIWHKAKLLNEEKFYNFLGLNDNRFDLSVKSIDDVIGSMTENRDWYYSYKKSHNIE